MRRNLRPSEGDEVVLDGIHYKAKEQHWRNGCDGCHIGVDGEHCLDSRLPYCSGILRTDNRYVIWIKESK